MPFLTLEDPNARIKGSRDPLGLQPIWAGFARQVVTNLTTQTTSVRGFTTLMLGRYFADLLVEEGTVPREESLNVFLRMEQLSAYARYTGHGVESEIRGIDRVKAFLEEGKGTVTIQSDRKGMILSDQKIYGLWGLYSVSARVSGLIPHNSYGLTPEAREFVERVYFPAFGSSIGPLKRILATGGKINTKRREGFFEALVVVLSPDFTPLEVEFYGRLLRDAEKVKTSAGRRQALFRELLERHADLEAPVGRAEVLGLAQVAGNFDEGLALALRRIVVLESLFAPAGALFAFLRTQPRQTATDVAAKVSDVWGKGVPNLDPDELRGILSEMSEVARETVGKQMDRSAHALAAGRYDEALYALLEWNKRVMETRKAGPWALIDEGRRLEVRYRDLGSRLPEGDELPSLWHNGYFIDSLKGIIRQLRNRA